MRRRREIKRRKGMKADMKKKWRNAWLLLACMLVLTTAVPAAAAPAAAKTTAAVQKKAVRKGWYKLKSGKKRYFRNGKYVKGLQKIGSKRYYFSSKGYMMTGTVKVKKVTYYLGSTGVLEGTKVGYKYYYANGKKMSKLAAQNFETLQTAKKIAAGITNSRMSQSQKMERCFRWVMAKPYVTRRVFRNTSGWPSVYANDHFKLGGGNCFADAAAFAYLAKAVGCKNVYVCVDSKGINGHAWAEINGLVYDPLFAQSKSYAGNYGAGYGTYRLYPVLHIAI